MESKMDSKPYWMHEQYVIQALCQIYDGKIPTRDDFPLENEAMARGNVALSILKAATPKMSNDVLITALVRMQALGMVMACDTKCKSIEIYSEIELLPEIRRQIEIAIGKPILSRSEIEDYAARCANKAYEEAIHRATHGLVTLREIRDAA